LINSSRKKTYSPVITNDQYVINQESSNCSYYIVIKTRICLELFIKP